MGLGKVSILLFQAELLHQVAICALVGLLKVFQVLAAVGDEPEKPAARVLVLAIFV